MTVRLVQNADVLVTMDSKRRELRRAWIAIEDGVVRETGEGPAPETWTTKANDIIDAAGCVVTPGLVNTHHHLFQTLTRAVPAALSAPLFGWLKSLYPIWSRYGPEEVFVSAQLGLAELALSGCTMSSDHLYLYPNGVRLEDTIEAAATLGIRLHATRGAMSVGESAGGLPPDALVEREADILEDCVRVIDAFHDPREGALVRVAIAPCSPFSVSRDLMRETAILARDKGVRLHTHLAENVEDVAYSLSAFGCRPGQYAEELGWVGEDVWHAHCVQLDAEEIALFAQTKTGVAHCPCSNCRLASGIAPVRAMRDAGVPVGLGVDGSASNDSGHLLLEARQAMLLQRVALGADAMDPREALELATLGGASLLGRSDLGALVAGRRADLAIWDLRSCVGSAGAWDPVAALVMCGPFAPRDVLVEGEAVVRDGMLVRVDFREIITNARAAAARLAAG